MVNDTAYDLRPEELALLERAWPTGIPEAEIGLLRATRPDRRELVIQRLSVLLALEEHARTSPGKQAGFADWAGRLGLGRTGLMKLRKAWSDCRSLASITPFASLATPEQYEAALRNAHYVPVEKTDANTRKAPPLQRASSGKRKYRRQIDASDELLRLIKTTLLSDPRASNGAVARTVLSSMPDIDMSKPTLVALVQRVRLEQDAEPTTLNREYGRKVIVDVCAADLFVIEPLDGKANADRAADQASMVMLAVVMETASRSVLGWSIGPDATIGLQRAAIAMFLQNGAAASIANVHVDDSKPEIVFVPPPDDEASTVEALKCISAEVTFPRIGPRRFGRRLTSLVGARIGRLGLRPASTPSGVDRHPVSWSPVVRSWGDAQSFVSAAMLRHQRAVDEQIITLDRAIRNDRTAAINRKLGNIMDILDRKIRISTGDF